MARFCGNCGMLLDENAKICTRCRRPVTGNPQKFPNWEFENQEKKRKFKKKFKIAVVLAFIVAASIITFQIVLNLTGNRGMVHKVMSAYEKYDIDTLVSLSSDMYYYGEETFAENYFENSVGNQLDSFENIVGHNFKIDYKIVEVYELSERNKDEILDNIEYTYPQFDIGIIENISMAEVSVTARKDEKTVSRAVEITLTKEDGKWKLLYIN